MTAPLRFALVPVEPTGDMEHVLWRGPALTVDDAWRDMLAASPGNDLLERIVRALNSHAVNLRNDGFVQASNDIEKILCELGGGHG